MNFQPSPMDKLKNLVRSKFNEKYKNTCDIDKMQINILIFNKNSHYSSVFKDRMIADYIDEFFKRYYFAVESYDRIPKMAKYYFNYLNFFCKPIFRDFYVNSILKRYGDNRAELYYVRNYGRSVDLAADNSNHEEKKHNVQTLLTTTVKDNINRNSILQNKNNNSNSSNSNNLTNLLIDESISKSGLLTKRSNRDESLVNILFQMDPLKINEQFLVKDKMNYKKNQITNYSKNSNVDKTTKDYSIKTHKEIINIDLNKIEIKDVKTMETEREDLKNSILKNYNESASAKDASPAKYPKVNELNYLNVPSIQINGLPTSKNVEGKISSSNNPKTRNKNGLTQKTEFTLSQALPSNIYSTQVKEKSSTLQNKFLENIQNEALKALQKIKKTKLEFKNIVGKEPQNDIKVIYLDTQTAPNVPLSKHQNNNDNLLALNDMLRLTLNDKNSRNKPRNETKTEFKPTVQSTIIKNKNSVDVNTSRREKNHLIIPYETNTQPNKINLSNSKSKSPNNKDISPTLNLNLNLLKNLGDKTKMMSRNKNPSLNILHSNNTKTRNEKPSKEKDSSNNAYKSFKSYKSSKKEKSIITQTVNLNIPTPDIQELEKKIFGTFASNYKLMTDIVNKNLKSGSFKKTSVEKDKKNLKVTKTINNLLYSNGIVNSKNQINPQKQTNRIINNVQIVTHTQNTQITQATNNNIRNTKSLITSSNLNPSVKNKKTNISSTKKNPCIDLQIVNKKKNIGVFNLYSTSALTKK